MDVTKYKPGRRLDAMVAMALGWKWFHWKDHESDGRWLAEKIKNPSRMTVEHLRDSPKELPLKTGTPRSSMDNPWHMSMSMHHWSTNPGAAFEAALEAGVPKYATYHQSYRGDEWKHALYSFSGRWDVVSDTPAHCLCLGILAIQPAENLAEYESWLEGVE